MLPTAIDYQLPDRFKGTIIENIVDAKLRELVGAKHRLPAESIESVLDRAPDVRRLKAALARHNPAIIAEIKKSSPSAGNLCPDFDPIKIARAYQEAGAAAISVVTEARHFHGRLETLAVLRWNSGLPLLRKDFIVDPYQILEARHAGADAVLLIAALLDNATLETLRRMAEGYGMEALVEVHDRTELQRALDCGASLIGVNNRDLRTFEVSLEVSIKLASSIPKEVTAISESGIHRSEDIRMLSEAGYRGFLVGEHLMRAPSPGVALSELIRGQARQAPN